MSVNQFRGDNFYLSNMYQCKVPMCINGKIYQFSSVEAAFQAHKDPERAKEFVGIYGKDAKRLGRQVNIRPDWETIKDNIMRDCIKSKFKHNPELATKLKNTEGLIAENNTWGDRYWGICGGVGQNKLGQILMEERDSLCTKAQREI